MIDRIIDFSAQEPRSSSSCSSAPPRVAGWWSLQHVPLDAIPDLSDTQVIVYSRWDRSPDIIEDQVTYPIVTAMLGAPQGARRSAASPTSATRSSTSSSRTAPTSTGRARARSSTCRRCCRGCRRASKTELGPDATGLGWVFQYALVDRLGHSTASPSCARYQDWYLRYHLQVGARRGRGGVARRLRPAVPGQRRSRTACAPTASRSARSSRRCAAATTTSAAG